MIKDEQSKLAGCLVSHALMLDHFTPSSYDPQYNLESLINDKVGLLGLAVVCPQRFVCLVPSSATLIWLALKR